MIGKKLFKKLIRSFGGYALYFSKSMLNHLDLNDKDEVKIEFIHGAIIITKSDLSDAKIEEMMQLAIQQTKTRI